VESLVDKVDVVNKVDKSDGSSGVTGGKGSVKPRVGRMSMDKVSTVSRFEVVKFDGFGNFGLWHIRVKDLLTQQGNLMGLPGRSQRRWRQMTRRRSICWRPQPYDYVCQTRSCTM
jgi:hypothetical protein